MRLLTAGHRDAARQLHRAVKSGRLETDRRRAVYIAQMQRRYFPDDIRVGESRKQRFSAPANHRDPPKAFRRSIGIFFGAASGVLLIVLLSLEISNDNRTFLSSFYPLGATSGSQSSLANTGKDTDATDTPVTDRAKVNYPVPNAAKGSFADENLVPPEEEKSVATARLEVADVSGNPNSPIDLDLKAFPGRSGQEIELRVSGIPEDAYLTAGTKISPASLELSNSPKLRWLS